MLTLQEKVTILNSLKYIQTKSMKHCQNLRNVENNLNYMQIWVYEILI